MLASQSPSEVLASAAGDMRDLVRDSKGGSDAHSAAQCQAGY